MLTVAWFFSSSGNYTLPEALMSHIWHFLCLPIVNVGVFQTHWTHDLQLLLEHFAMWSGHEEEYLVVFFIYLMQDKIFYRLKEKTGG